jgi:hypothetical protein
MRKEQICPDGVIINVNWDTLEVGMSFFVPAVNLSLLDKQVKEIARYRGWKLEGRNQIEGSKLGIRFWRIL